jgi:hypothetical protein
MKELGDLKEMKGIEKGILGGNRHCYAERTWSTIVEYYQMELEKRLGVLRKKGL